MCNVNSKGFDAQFCANIDGVPTEFVLQRFINKWLVIITQYQKMTNIFTVSFDMKHRGDSIPVPLPNSEDRSIPITITNTFGTDTDEARGAIQFLINNSDLSKCPTELVISFGLKETNGKNLREIAKVLNEVIEIK